jgi:phosphomethylpyrimidine synthase
MTQLELARKNKTTALMRQSAKKENVDSAYLRKKISEGKVVIPANINHRIRNICAIGQGLKTKVNVNIGTSTDKTGIEDELKKLEIAIRYGADTIMDLSVGGNLRNIRKRII